MSDYLNYAQFLTLLGFDSRPGTLHGMAVGNSYFVGSPGDADDGDGRSHSKDLYEGIARQLVERVAAKHDRESVNCAMMVEVTRGGRRPPRPRQVVQWVRVEDARAMLTAMMEGLLEGPELLTLEAAKAWTLEAEDVLKDWLREWQGPL